MFCLLKSKSMLSAYFEKYLFILGLAYVNCFGSVASTLDE